MMTTKSPRRQKQEFYHAQQKRWLAPIKKENQLRELKWDAPLVPLEKPYQRGLVRFFQLDKSLQKKADFAEISAFFEAQINNTQYCRHGHFKE